MAENAQIWDMLSVSKAQRLSRCWRQPAEVSCLSQGPWTGGVDQFRYTEKLKRLLDRLSTACNERQPSSKVQVSCKYASLIQLTPIQWTSESIFASSTPHARCQKGGSTLSKVSRTPTPFTPRATWPSAIPFDKVSTHATWPRTNIIRTMNYKWQNQQDLNNDAFSERFCENVIPYTF